MGIKHDMKATYVRVMFGKYKGCAGYIDNAVPRKVNIMCKIWKNGRINPICLPEEYFRIIEPHPLLQQAM